MSARFLHLLSIGLMIFAIVSCLPLSSQANVQKPEIFSHGISGVAPTINGIVNDGEWPDAPQLVFNQNTPPTADITYVIPTYVYFCNDPNHIYVLVDVVGDTTDNVWDECLLIFGNGNQTYIPEGFGNGNLSSCTPQGITFATGMGASPNSETIHRIFEWKIPFVVLGATAGLQLDFCSPHYWKFQCPVQNGSLGYDASTGYDNVWPPGLVGLFDPQDRSQWGIFQPCNLLYDLNDDSKVDIADIMQVAARWNTKTGDQDYDAQSDLNGDGKIDIVDIMQVAAHWGESCN